MEANQQMLPRGRILHNLVRIDVITQIGMVVLSATAVLQQWYGLSVRAAKLKINAYRLSLRHLIQPSARNPVTQKNSKLHNTQTTS
jgi:hypothetical protein